MRGDEREIPGALVAVAVLVLVLTLIALASSRSVAW